MRLTSRRGAFSGFKAGLALLALVFAAAPADAAVTYQYVAGQSLYTGTPGQVLTVPIYLRETFTGDTSFIATENGVFGAAFSVSTSGTSVSYSLDANTTDFAGPVTVNASSLSESVSPTATSGVVGTVTVVGSVRDVPLGSIELTVGNGSTTFTLARYNDFSGNTMTFANFADLDFPAVGAPYAAAQGSSFVVAVPEPASAAALLLVPFVTLLRRRRCA